MASVPEAKRRDFLWFVQTYMLAHREGTVGFTGVIGDALAASFRIPSDMTVRDAALDFCEFMVEGGRERAEGDRSRKCPEWFQALEDKHPERLYGRGAPALKLAKASAPAEPGEPE